MAQLTLYNDYSSKKRKKRCRLMLVPGSAATYVPVLEPEWGEDPAPTSTFRKCPAFTILENANNGKTAFDALPTGMSTKAGRNVGINLSRMSTGDLLTARDAITSLTINTGTLSTVGSGPSIDLPNQWILLEGDVGDDIADFDVVFHGIQVPTRKREFDAVPNQRVEMSFECMHICEFISRMVHPTWVEERVADVGTLESDGQLFLHLWKEGTELLSQTAIPEENLPAISTTSRFRFRKMTHVAFYGIVMDIMNECYQFLTRQTRSTSTKSFALRSFRSAPVASGGVGMPIDRGGFFKQDHTKANAAGAIISRDNTKLIAYVIDTDNSDVVVAGQLSDGDGGRLDFESMWEWFDLECKSIGSRGEYKAVDTATAELWFRAPAESSATHDLSYDDIEKVAKISQGAFALKEAKVSRPGAGALDAPESLAVGSPHAVVTWGSESSVDVGAVNGDKEDLRAYSLQNSGYFPSHSSLIGSAIGLPIGIYDRIYYDESSSAVAAGGTADMTCAAHHKVRLYDGIGGHADYDVTTPELPATIVDDHLFEGLIRGIVTANITAQLEAGIPGAMARDVIARFGSAEIAEVGLVVRRSAIPHSCHGDTIRITPIVGSDYTGRYLAGKNGDAILDEIPGIGIIIEVEPDERAGKVAITALMLRKQ